MIETCRSGIEGANGKVANSSFIANTSTACANTLDTYVDFQPIALFLAFDFALKLPVDPPEKHNYVHDYHFGIVEGIVDVIYYNANNGKWH